MTTTPINPLSLMATAVATELHGAMTPELRKEIADLSRTPPPATDRLEEQKAVAR